MQSIRAERRIAADPTGTALLLAGQTAFDLWPGATRLDGAARLDGATLLVRVPRRPAARVAVRARPPRRLPTSYVTTFRVDGDLPETDGTVTLTRAWQGERPATDAVLTVTWDGDARLAGPLRAMADGFLANLAAAAEQRSFAA
ncbi:MAG TPA: hypothetical protein VF519_03985 [Mycobacteriales bacterium]|jgi:hypothetical protein